MRKNGFSSIEALISVTIISILATAALPSLTRQLRQQQSVTFANELFHAIQFTRNQAVTTNQRVAMKALHDDWSSGWEIFLDTNMNGERSDDERLLTIQAMTPSVKIQTGQKIKGYLAFKGSGECVTGNGLFGNDTFKICSTNHSDPYRITLSKGGRARVEKGNPSDCL